MLAMRGEVTGKVQGVFFRKNTKAQADMLGITGWVCNTKAGTVAFLIVGEESAIVAMQQWLQQGPRLARVDKVECETCQVENLTGFTINY
jgi:acylphosphatase